jgi:hypothetical protein
MNGDGPLPTDEPAAALPEESASEPGDLAAVQVFDAYLARIEAGHPADPEQLLAEHPEIAEQLRSFLDVANQIGQIAGEPPPALEDYRIVREIGRGGMGIVYEARQLSRGRRVALKVLPSATALDPRQLRRFQNEAQAARLLRHAHIVPVTSFGCERGVYSFAMQFIDGQNLADLIQGLRQSEAASSPGSCSTRDRAFFAKAARWAYQAAEALDHAHEQGVVHRDIKPSNLLIDTHGNLWITDFGLAQIRGEDGLTRTGDLIGTLRYMSPEQALGKRVVIDGRTDIYSLGVTFYELLTLRPAFDGHDRQVVLRQIAQEEPPAPRRIAPAIPRNLETIVLKAMAKDREDRYATAHELAEDLKRFVEAKSIRARPPSLLDRLTRWARHHRPAVAAAIVTLVAAVVALGIGTGLVIRAQWRAARALLIQQQLLIRLAPHSDGWSGTAWDLIHAASRIQSDPALGAEAAATLIGLDASVQKRIATPACSTALDPTGKRLLAGGLGRGATLWHVGTDRTERFEQSGLGPVAFRADGTPVQLVLDNLESWRSLRLHDLAGRKVVARFEVPQKDSSGAEPDFLATRLTPELVLTPDASLAAFAVPWSDGTGSIFVWDGGTGALRHHFDERVTAVAFSPDGSLLATGRSDGRITVRSLAMGRSPVTLQAGRVTIRCLAFGRDAWQPTTEAPAGGDGHGQAAARWLLASGDAGGTVVVWDIAKGGPRAFCRGSHYDVHGVAFFPDGATLASCGRVDVRLWDIASGRFLLGMHSWNYLSRPGV